MEAEIKNDADIAKALQEFDVASKAEASKTVKQQADASNGPAMAKTVIKLTGGAVKNESQATYVLLFIAILMIGTALYLFIKPSIKRKMSPESVEKFLKIRPEAAGTLK